jgi:hypothetical protein
MAKPVMSSEPLAERALARRRRPVDGDDHARSEDARASLRYGK